MKTINIVSLVVFCFVSASSQNIKTGLPFLKLGTDARSSAMGEAFTAIINDHSSFYYNPASIRLSDRHQLSLSHREGFAETTTDYLGATIPGNDITVAVSAFTTSVNEIEVRLRPGEAEGSFGARNAAISAGAAITVSENMIAGISGKLLYEKIYIDEASGYSFDGGILYQIADNMNVGLSILNVGTMGVLRAERSILPTTVRTGGSYGTSLSTEFSLLTSGDIVKTLNDEGLHLHVGAETVFNSMFMVRAGYQTGYETKSFSGGVGIQYGIIRFDYAFVPMNGAFSANHTFSLVFLL